MTDATVALAAELIARPSVTPADAGCQDLLAARLANLGFAIHDLSAEGVRNTWARWGEGGPLWVFAGHTDVVPPGPLDRWSSPPFTPTVRAGHLVGRGAADMKGALAAMVVALEEVLATVPTPTFSLGMLLTSDEEGPALHGTQQALAQLMPQLAARGDTIAGCLIGEPSSKARLGDQIKHGRRGSLHGQIIIEGKQGHVAYPSQVQNPIPLLARVMADLDSQQWDEGDHDFPPTSLQFSNLSGGQGALNVVPATAECRFNFRFSPTSPVETLQTRVQQVVDTVLLNEEVASGRVFGHHMIWNLAGVPFLTADGAFRQAVMNAVDKEIGQFPRLSTDGGTSDGRFIAPYGIPVVELGLINATIHQIDERVSLADLQQLTRVYKQLLIELSQI